MHEAIFAQTHGKDTGAPKPSESFIKGALFINLLKTITMSHLKFDKLQALDDFSKLSAKPIVTPSDSIRYMNEAMNFLQNIHDQAYEAGYQDCLNTDTSKL